MKAAAVPTDHAPVVINPLLIYPGVLLLGALLQWALPLPFLAPAPARLIGLAFLLVDLVIGLPAVRAFLKAHTSLNPARPVSSLVFSGSYRFTRNPMYLGLTFIYTGLAIIFRLPWALLLLPLLIWLITTWVIVPEEKYLEGKFGSQYTEYKQRVHRWL